MLLHSHENKSKFIGWQGWVKVLIKPNMTTLFDPYQTFWRGVYFIEWHFNPTISTNLKLFFASILLVNYLFVRQPTGPVWSQLQSRWKVQKPGGALHTNKLSISASVCKIWGAIAPLPFRHPWFVVDNIMIFWTLMLNFMQFLFNDMLDLDLGGNYYWNYCGKILVMFRPVCSIAWSPHSDLND